MDTGLNLENNFEYLHPLKARNCNGNFASLACLHFLYTFAKFLCSYIFEVKSERELNQCLKTAVMKVFKIKTLWINVNC